MEKKYIREIYCNKLILSLLLNNNYRLKDAYIILKCGDDLLFHFY
jgi:hypothetical protein